MKMYLSLCIAYLQAYTTFCNIMGETTVKWMLMLLDNSFLLMWNLFCHFLCSQILEWPVCSGHKKHQQYTVGHATDIRVFSFTTGITHVCSCIRNRWEASKIGRVWWDEWMPAWGPLSTWSWYSYFPTYLCSKIFIPGCVMTALPCSVLWFSFYRVYSSKLMKCN